VWFGFGEREIERGTDIQIEGEIEREGREIGRERGRGKDREGRREIGRERKKERERVREKPVNLFCSLCRNENVMYFFFLVKYTLNFFV
jgi:hypothetical protein